MSRVAAFFARLRDVWAAIGIAVAFFFLLEGGYNGQLALRHRVQGSDDVREANEPGHPYAHEAWFADFLEARAALHQRFDPARVYWAYPVTSRYLNVDTAGYRVTIPAAPATAAPGPRPRLVYLLGASAMWGYTARDSMTIPSLVARGLAAAGVTDVQVLNLAQPGYTLSQEVSTLVKEVQARGAPAVALFFDGINDIRTTQLTGEPGHTFFEPRFKHLYEVESQRGMLGSLMTVGERSRLISRLAQAVGVDPWKIRPQEPQMCPSLGAYYRRMARTARGIGDAWGFDVLVVQQPNHAATRKSLTPFERSIAGPAAAITFTRDCSDAIDAALAGDSTLHTLSMTRVFDADTGTVFLDRFGHVTEGANARLADALVKAILPRLQGSTQ